MQGVSKEWLDFLRNQFPAGSRIQTWELDDPRNTLEEAGTLEHIDDSGRFHVRQSDGGECVLTLGEEMFSVHPPEPKSAQAVHANDGQLLCPEWLGNWDETGEEWTARKLLDYEMQLPGLPPGRTAGGGGTRPHALVRQGVGVNRKVLSCRFTARPETADCGGVAECLVVGSLQRRS